MEEEASEPELLISKTGALAIIAVLALGAALIIIGQTTQTIGLVLWGMIFFVGAILSTIPITARIVAYKALIHQTKQAELEKAIQQRLKKIQQKQREQEQEQQEQ